MQTRDGPPQPLLHVRGLVLPALLAELLASGRWQHPGDDVLHEALPWLEEPIIFLSRTDLMERESQSLDRDAEDEGSSQFFHVTRGSREGLCSPGADPRASMDGGEGR